MTKEQLVRLKDILTWSLRQCKTNGMYDSIIAMKRVVDLEIEQHEEVEQKKLGDYGV